MEHLSLDGDALQRQPARDERAGYRQERRRGVRRLAEHAAGPGDHLLPGRFS